MDLQARVEALERENAELRSRYAPDLVRRVTVAGLLANVDTYLHTHIGVGGWIRTARSSSKELAFVKLFDGSTSSEVQVVVNGATKVDDRDALLAGSTGASIFVEGKVVASLGKEQAVELQAVSIRILGLCDAESFPLSKTKLPISYLRDLQHLRPRSRVIGSATRIRNTLAYATHTFFQQQGYLYVNTPLITASDCEGAGEMFQVTTLLEDGKVKATLPDGKADYSKDFFKKPAFLTVSGQLNAEIYATALSSVYTFGPTFRAENSNTSRHLAEFWMIEPEIAFADNEENMKIAEAFIKFTIKACLAECAGDMEYLEQYEKQANKERAAEEANQAAAAKKKQKDDAKAAKAAKAKAAKEAKAADAPTDTAAPPATDKSEPAKAAEQEKAKPAAKKPKVKKVVSPEEKALADKVGAAAGVLMKAKKSGAPKEEIDAAQATLNAAKDELRVFKGVPEKKPQPNVQKQQPKEEKKKAAPKKEVKWNDIPLRERLTKVVTSSFARVSYTDAVTIVQQAAKDKKAVFVEELKWGDDMGSEHERYLCERHFNRPTIVFNYPKSFKSFYMRANEDGKTVAAMDLLVPGVGELVGGSQREERLDKLLEMMAEKGLNPEDYQWYLDLRRYGSVPHSGFGLGFERLVCYTTGLSNIRDVIPFPRFPGHCEY